MTDPDHDQLRREAALVADIAAEMAVKVTARADYQRVSRAINAFTVALHPGGTNADTLLALGVMVSVQAQLAAEECHTDPDRALSVIATLIGMIARNAVPIALPTAPNQIN